MTRRTLPLALLVLIPIACDAAGESAAGQVPREAVSIEVKAISAPAAEGAGSLAAPDDDGESFMIDAAMVHIRDIELYLPAGTQCDDLDEANLDGFSCEDETSDDDDDDAAKLVLEGPFDVDLVAGEVLGDAVALPVGDYTRVDVRVDDNEDDVSFMAAGTMAVDGVETEVEVRLDFNEDIRFEGDFSLGESDSVGSFVIGLDVQDWLAGVPLHQCVARERPDEGKLVVGDANSGSGSCSDLINGIRDNVEASGKLLVQ